MKKKIIGGAAVALAALGLYKVLESDGGDSGGEQNGAGAAGEVWSAADVPDLSGKVIVVTGANSGVGFEAAKVFAQNGAKTILACRNRGRAENALRDIESEVPGAAAEVMILDLASLDSVHHFADAFKARYEQLDVLVNNAGIMMVPYGRTEEGFELQFGTNHLGHFALTGLLLGRILQTPGARVVTVSSSAHRWARADFDNLMYEGGKGYSPRGAYGRSKLANLLFTHELQRRFEAVGADAMALAAHPGFAATNLSSHLTDHWYARPFRPLLQLMAQSAAMGALPAIRAAVDPQAGGGQYFGPGGFMEQRGYPVVVQTSRAAHDREAARWLWQRSEELTGVRYEELDRVPAA